MNHLPASRVNKAGIFGWALLALVIYCTLGAAVYFVSLLALQNGRLINLPWIVSAQKSLYRGGMISVPSWLAVPGCITPDTDLIYKPANGQCKFDDIEFATTLTFTEEGRDTGPKPAGIGIAVIGDSHAMGWGVNDLETFSAQLQKRSGRPVYNLAVASYGTARELIRLEKSNVLDKVDTIILQYCNNDRNENLHFDAASREQLSRRIFQAGAAPVTPPPGKFVHIAKGYWIALTAPLRSLAEKLRRKSFRPHYEALLPVLEQHRATLAGKRVIVFYSNPYGQKYRNFPSGQDKRMPNVHFVDLDLPFSAYRRLDNHLNPAGHEMAAERLLEYLHSMP